MVPNPSDVTPENIDAFLLKSLEVFSVQIGMTQEDEEEEAYGETVLDRSTIFAFQPENIPVMADTQHPDDVYSCFFSEAAHYVASVTAEYFLKPQNITVLELMCLARIDFVDAGNELEGE